MKLILLSFLLISTFSCHVFAHAPIAEADLERCRAIEYDSEPCWLELLDFVEREKEHLTVTLYNGTEKTFTNYVGDCLDPCGPFNTIADYIPEQGILILTYMNEAVVCYELISMITGEIISCIGGLQQISPDYRYYALTVTETDSPIKPRCSHILMVYEVSDKHSQHIATEVVLELWQRDGTLCPKWETESILAIYKYALDPNFQTSGKRFMEEPFDVEIIDFDPPRVPIDK